MARVSRIFVTCAAAVLFLYSFHEMKSFKSMISDTEKPEEIRMRMQEKSDETEQEIIGEPIQKKQEFNHETWNVFHEINPDFIGYLRFDSGLISQPVVQGNDNSFYLNHAYDRSQNHMGAAFVNASQLLSDTNLVIYGHNVYADHSAMFSPLQDLVFQQNYEKNRTLKIWYETEEVSYQVTAVYYFDCDDYEQYDYEMRNFVSQSEFNVWIEYVLKRNLINSDEQIRYGDRFITLQTCRKFDPDHRLILLCREMERKEY